MRYFNGELDFEEAVVEELKKNGWNDKTLNEEIGHGYITEKDLIANWKKILSQTNANELHQYPLTDNEMKQVLDKVSSCGVENGKFHGTPFEINGLIKDKFIIISRDDDSPDLAYRGKDVWLKIFDYKEIACGKSVYQIVEQPEFSGDDRADIILLINGMPLIHMELKLKKSDLNDACNQIRRYADDKIFMQGIFSMVQVFVAMTPEETVYFANPLSNVNVDIEKTEDFINNVHNAFNEKFYFHWADSTNQPINEWDDVIRNLLSIPMAHQLIGFYTIADGSDHQLKVMRSYQYYAVKEINKRVNEITWDDTNQRGGYIWHTTGSGKTMTSLKAAQLIADYHKEAKVIFLVDRIELETQSLENYRKALGGNLSENEQNDLILNTESTRDLYDKIMSDNQLIVTTIQKMSRVCSPDIYKKSTRTEKNNEFGHLYTDDQISLLQDKHIIFIVDECHRDVFGDMFNIIRSVFPHAIFFGFTGTPIQRMNSHNGTSTTEDLFGNELHRYTIADGINDGNVLKFDIKHIDIFRKEDIRDAVACRCLGEKDIDDILANSDKRNLYQQQFENCDMAGHYDGKDYIKGIEDYLPDNQYRTEEYLKAVVRDINDNFKRVSKRGPVNNTKRFHAILATSSIIEAIDYYLLFKQETQLKVTALFDPTIDNSSNNDQMTIIKGPDFEDKDDENKEPSLPDPEDWEKCCKDKYTAYTKKMGLLRIISDYNKQYKDDTDELKYTLKTWSSMKRDIAQRLAHKGRYIDIDKKEDKQIDLLIVVNQMLTGFDSKWVNTLYLDKVLEYEGLIQAFSRTNRIFDANTKPCGIIRYYRRPYTMERNVDAAIKLYAGENSKGIYTPTLKEHCEEINTKYNDIKRLFSSANIKNFEKLPKDNHVFCQQFANDFRDMYRSIDAAMIQGFSWENSDKNTQENSKDSITVLLNKTTYTQLADLYHKLFHRQTSNNNSEEAIYNLDPYIANCISTVEVTPAYLNQKFKQYKQALLNDDPKAIEISEELHSRFASLSPKDQETAEQFMLGLQDGSITELDPDKTFQDYINDFRRNKQDSYIQQAVQLLGVNQELLEKCITHSSDPLEGNNRAIRNQLYRSIDYKLCEKYCMEHMTENKSTLPRPIVNQKIYKLLNDFIEKGGFDLKTYVF